MRRLWRRRHNCSHLLALGSKLESYENIPWAIGFHHHRQMSQNILYNRIGGAYDSTRRADPFIARQLAAHVIPNDKNQCVDIACGTGNYTTLLADHVGGSWTGVDQSTRMLRVAAEKSPTICWTAASVEALPFPAKTFDSALCTNAIHHFPNLPDAFREIRQTRSTALSRRAVSRRNFDVCRVEHSG